jgi:hypothetical protein
VVLCYQKLDWEKFRKLQAIVRCRKRSFSNFVDEIRERRQRHGLGGDVRFLLNTEQQSRLDNWIEFQNRHLKRLEQFEKERDNLKQQLEDSQKLGGDRSALCPKFGPTRVEALKRRLKITERDLKWHHVLLHWVEQQRLAMNAGHPTSVEEDHKNQDATPKAVRRTSTRGYRTKQKNGPSALGNVRVTKVKPKERNTRDMRIQKCKAPKLEPLIQNFDVILQSRISQASKHSKTKQFKTKPWRTKIDRPLRQIHRQKVSKESRFAGIKVKSLSAHEVVVLSRLNV